MILISQNFFLGHNDFRWAVPLYITFPSTSFLPPSPPPPSLILLLPTKVESFFFPWEDWLTNSPRITSRISLVPDVIRSPYIKNVGLSVLQTTGRVSVAVALWISGNVTVLTYRAFKRTGFSTVEAERKWILIANSSGLWSYDNHGWCAVWKMK